MSQPKILVDAFGQALKAAGFKKQKSDTWYRSNADVISVLNIQKSNYGKQYYVNMAIWVKALGDAKVPSESHCHIRCRLNDLILEDESRIAQLLDLEDLSVSEACRLAEIKGLLEEYILPFFSCTSTLDGLKEAFNTNAWLRSYATARARSLLEESVERQ